LVTSSDIGTTRYGNSVVRAGRLIEIADEHFDAACGPMFCERVALSEQFLEVEDDVTVLSEQMFQVRYILR